MGGARPGADLGGSSNYSREARIHNKMRIFSLRAEVGKGSVTTVVDHGLAGPKAVGKPRSERGVTACPAPRSRPPFHRGAAGPRPWSVCANCRRGYRVKIPWLVPHGCSPQGDAHPSRSVAPSRGNALKTLLQVTLGSRGKPGGESSPLLNGRTVSSLAFHTALRTPMRRQSPANFLAGCRVALGP